MLGVPYPTEGSDGPAHDWLLAVGADALQQFEVVGVAIQPPFILVTVSSLEFATAFLALEVVRAHALPVQDDVLADDGLLALAADPRGGLDGDRPRRLARHAERFPIVLFVGFSAQLSAASRAVEVLGVVDLPDRVDARVGDRLHAVRALRA